MNLVQYVVKKNNEIIDSGMTPTFYIHGLVASVIQVTDADEILIVSKDKTLSLKSPKVLHKTIPESVSEKDHNRWFSGCRFEL